jgi:hypothetical protein
LTVASPAEGIRFAESSLKVVSKPSGKQRLAREFEFFETPAGF